MLELKNICKRFPAKTVACDISLTVENGRILAVLGASGSGKSTLLNMIAGLTEPDSGDILLAGRRLNGLPPQRRGCAMMFQDFALLPHLNVWQNAAFGLRLRGTPKAEARRRAEAVLEQLGMAALAERRVTALSGGEQQRVALARALLAEPQVMLLDEPFSSLDTMLRSQLQSQVREQVVRCAVPAVLLSHDPAEACLTADAIALLAAGRIIQHGTPQQILARPASAAAARLLGCLNVSETRYVPPDAIRLGGEGESCRITGIFRQPERWRVELDHPQLGRLTAFCEQAERPDWDGHCKAAVDYVRIVDFDGQAA